MAPRRPVPVGSDGRGSFEPRLVDGDVESQGNLLSDARTAPGGIALLDLDDGINEFSTGSSGPGPPPLLGKRRGGDPFGSSGPGGGARESKVSERWRNGSGGTAVSTERTHRRRGGPKGGEGERAGASD